jgi:hypothetical protein
MYYKVAVLHSVAKRAAPDSVAKRAVLAAISLTARDHQHGKEVFYGIGMQASVYNNYHAYVWRNLSQSKVM